MISTKILDIGDTFQNNSGNKHFLQDQRNEKMIIIRVFTFELYIIQFKNFVTHINLFNLKYTC